MSSAKVNDSNIFLYTCHKYFHISHIISTFMLKTVPSHRVKMRKSFIHKCLPLQSFPVLTLLAYYKLRCFHKMTFSLRTLKSAPTYIKEMNLDISFLFLEVENFYKAR